ncbi:MAG: hypothetical protein Q7U85_05615 [Rhodocyclaceae bacterium]|nr:hypothetical protein [Rhodocyclaceae bacterium]
MTAHALENERLHLSGLLEAIQRCIYFLAASNRRLTWPLTGDFLNEHQKDVELFEALAAINERFAKLQDTLGAAMRHAGLLAGEPGETFLKVLAFYEKIGVIDSVAAWQLCRAARNLAAHDYETEYAEIAEHFNSLHTLIPVLYSAADRFLNYCATALNVLPSPGHFVDDFARATRNHGTVNRG